MIKARLRWAIRRVGLLGLLGSALLVDCSPHYPRRGLEQAGEDGFGGFPDASTEGGSATTGGALAAADGGSRAASGGANPEPLGGGGTDVCGQQTCGSGGAAPPAGGAPEGGAPQGGAPQGGASGGAPGGATGSPQPFIVGADISSVQETLDQGALFVDTDGVQKPITELLKAHGFNFVRLRTFVDPANLYGYANPNGDDAYRKPEAYCDGDHTVEFGKQIKDAGMGLLVDLHYSDNWADPGKQIIPERWRGVTSIDELAEDVKLYTSALIQQLVDAGARPDMVQIGNEITPGMLIQVPAADPKPDQWGNLNKITNTINGSASNWANLGLLLKKGVEGVRSVDPDIKIVLHIENTSRASGVIGWVNNARSRGVEFDILGLSCYTTWQGQPEVWENTFRTVAETFPDLSFVIAEYGLERRRANDIMHDLAGGRGLGTFLWEPTQSGVWGSSMFTYLGNAYQANSEDFAVFDTIRSDYGLQ